MNNWKNHISSDHQNVKVLMVTAGLSTKRSFLTEAFKDMCQTDVVFGKAQKEGRIDRLLRPLNLGKSAGNTNAVNDAILKAVKSNSYDVLCIIKGLEVRKATLEAVKAINPQMQIVCWTCDDLALSHNQTQCFVKAAPAYDIIFTAKSNNLKYNELANLGFKNVEFFYQAYSIHDHIPIMDESSPFIGKVLFIGYAENKRFEYMNDLAKNGVVVDVYGNGWNKKSYENRRHENLLLHKKPLFERDYASAISNAAINLCFLREMNRDLHTSRTFEIPACQGFMLAERTQEHELLFEEGEEVEYFDNKAELLSKVNKYLQQPEKRERIAKQAYVRTQQEPYSYHHMVDKMLVKVLKFRYQ